MSSNPPRRPSWKPYRKAVGFLPFRRYNLALSALLSLAKVCLIWEWLHWQPPKSKTVAILLLGFHLAQPTSPLVEEQSRLGS